MFPPTLFIVDTALAATLLKIYLDTAGGYENSEVVFYATPEEFCEDFDELAVQLSKKIKIIVCPRASLLDKNFYYWKRVCAGLVAKTGATIHINDLLCTNVSLMQKQEGFDFGDFALKCILKLSERNEE